MLLLAHLFFGLGAVSFFTTEPIFLALAAFLSILPDFDRPFHHRAWFSHSPFSAAIFSLAAFIASGFRPEYALIILVAVSAHIFLDFFTHSGVPLLHPWKKAHYGLRVFASKDRLANKVCLILGLLMLLFNLWLAFA
jgi:membrane-bound metal-dependent hydrolase YbcI (DUF457 family)